MVSKVLKLKIDTFLILILTILNSNNFLFTIKKKLKCKYKTSGKKLCSWSIPEAYSYYFSPDGYSLITPATQESHPLFSQKQIEQIEYIQENVPNDLALQEYFLLKNCNTHDIEFKESLYKSSSKDCQQLYDTMTKQLGDGK